RAFVRYWTQASAEKETGSKLPSSQFDLEFPRNANSIPMIAVMAVITMAAAPIVRPIVAIVPIRPIVSIRIVVAILIIPWVISIVAWKSDPYPDRYSSIGMLNGNKGQ